MSIFIWKKEYSVYVEAIDDQHKQLVEILNELIDGMMNGKTKDILEPILNKLIEYTVQHFKDEEEYFDKIDYPQKDEHIEEHRKLIADVEKFKDEYTAGKIGITIELMRYLKEWLINHISGTDKELGKLLYKNGIQ